MGDDDSRADCHRLEQCISLLTLILRSQELSRMHEAATFSKLLCASKRLRAALLAAAVGRITLVVGFETLGRVVDDEERERNLVQWLHQHLHLQTLRQVECVPERAVCPQPIWKHTQSSIFYHAEDEQLDRVYDTLFRISTTLAAAHAFLGPRTPIVERWFAPDILPATLSVFAPQHLTQLVLACRDQRDRVWGELSALTSLKELRLPALMDATTAGFKLEDALKPLVQLTGLLLANPFPVVQQSIPASVQELVLLLTFCGLNHTEHLTLGHLSSLTALHLRHWGCPLDEIQEGVLQLSADLPDSLQLLAFEGTLTEASLMQASQLRVLRLLGFPHPMQHSCMAMVESKRLAHVTRLEVLQHSVQPRELPFESLRGESVQQMLSTNLPVYVPKLRLTLPTTAMKPSLISTGFEALGRLTSLTMLELSKSSTQRSAAILTAAAVAAGNAVGAGAWNGRVEQLAAALERLTNLEKLALKDVHMTDSSGVERATGLDWLPFVKAVAGLPRLQGLELSDIPLQNSVTALAPAQHLTSLCLASCSLSLAPLTLTLSDLACKERLRNFHAKLDQWSREDVKLLLTELGQNLTGLQGLYMHVHPSLHLLDNEYLEPLRNLEQLRVVMENHFRTVLELDP